MAITLSEDCDETKYASPNAVTFGGCDYVGFHTAMAMLPALEMSGLLSSQRQSLPILKVLYRNAQLNLYIYSWTEIIDFVLA